MLRQSERRILDAFVDALLPAGSWCPSGRDSLVSSRLERYMAGFPPLARRAFPLMLWAVELFPLGLGPLPRRFSSLAREDRTRVLERLESHRVYPLRAAFMGLKLVSSILHCEEETIAAGLEWGRPGGCAK